MPFEAFGSAANAYEYLTARCFRRRIPTDVGSQGLQCMKGMEEYLWVGHNLAGTQVDNFIHGTALFRKI
jgi:hypothetical protein